MNIFEVVKKENIGKEYRIFLDEKDLGVWVITKSKINEEFDFYQNYEVLSGCYISQVMRMEFAEVIDWSKVKTDTQVLVSDDCENWVNRHFAKYDKEKDKFYTWKDGKTSFTTDLKEEWEYWDIID